MHVEAFNALIGGGKSEIAVFGGFEAKNRRSEEASRKLYIQFKRCCLG